MPGYLLAKALFAGRNERDQEYNTIYEMGLVIKQISPIEIMDRWGFEP